MQAFKVAHLLAENVLVSLRPMMLLFPMEIIFCYCKEGVMKGLHDSESRNCTTSLHDSGTLTNISMEAVGKLLKRATSRSSAGMKKQDSYLCPESDGMSESLSKGKGKQNVGTTVTCNNLVDEGSSRDTIGNTPIEGKVEEGRFHHAFPDRKEDTDESDWEDGSIPVLDSTGHHPENLVREVTVEFSGSAASAKQKTIRRASAEDKELAEIVHKVHLLCLLARGRLIDSACSDPLIQASLLSLLPTNLLKIVEVSKLTANILTPLVDWFHKNFHIRSPNTEERSFKSSLAFALETHEGTAEEVAALSVALFRALNLTTRVPCDSNRGMVVLDVLLVGLAKGFGSVCSRVVSDVDAAIEMKTIDLLKVKGAVSGFMVQEKVHIINRGYKYYIFYWKHGFVFRFVSILDVASLKPDSDASGFSNQDTSRAETGIFNSSTLMVTSPNKISTPVQLSSHKTSFNKDIVHETFHRGACQIRESNLTCKTSQSKDLPVAGQPNNRMLDSLACEASNGSSEAGLTKKAEGSKRKGDLEFEMQLEMARFATSAGIRDSNLVSELKDLHNSSSDLPSSLKRMKRIQREESSISSQGISTAVGSRKVGPPLYWAEVYCSGENLTGKWVHVDAANLIIDAEQKVEAAAAACRRSLRYVVAFAGGGAKDVTRRIASQRINSHWWDAVLAPLKELESGATGGIVHLEKHPEKSLDEVEKVESLKMSDCSTRECLPEHVRLSGEMSKEHDMNIDVESSARNSRVATRNSLEDMELETRALTEPLPTNQQAYKNHQLYAIERWLTKYQILHPKGPILGFCSGHPVYPRTCVQMLHTKLRWLREGLQVKENEHPAKVVTHSRKPSKVQVSEPDLYDEDDGEGTIELYGKWQMEPLRLPHAVNGIVPKNERGQVDVWSKKCLPPGTVHLRLSRVVPVAKRLEIDFAPAMVGFEFRNGRCLPVFEGIVVCTEFKDSILEAYAEEQERREAEEKKRNETQAISRWYQLLSSIVTRQRLNNYYGDCSSSQTPNHIHQKDNLCGEQIVNSGDGMQSIACQQEYVRDAKLDAASTVLSAEHEHIFPLEDQSFDEESSVTTKRCPCGFSVEVEEF
ncbi:hypothetical protein HHK36_029951 [Tetracentron sinense]|uniref:DNA repair protein RAD4 n=1 Tax=Tetracentron sinense TaxID=13715 RepID=A0A834YBT0_TETSI|nr:hypothetical protein HHK36_029951 [Tetracentron sinense]